MDTKRATRGFPGLILAAFAVANMFSTGTANASFLHGINTTPVGEPAHCPREMALVGNTCVDRWEGSLVEVHGDGTESPFSPYVAPVGKRVRAVSQPHTTPQAHISMVDAQRACKASGKRLCRAAEWKTACKGPEKTRYPYGNTRRANVCTDTARSAPIMKLHHGEYTSRTMNDPTLNQLPNTLAQTGDAEACTNGFGVFDMVGNIHEWVAEGTFRGGYYLDTKINGEGCEYVTTAHAKDYYDYSTGFRCCADADSLPVEEERPRQLLDPTPSSPHGLTRAPAKTKRLASKVKVLGKKA